MSHAMFASTVSELAGLLLIVAVWFLFTAIVSRRAKVRADRAKRVAR